MRCSKTTTEPVLLKLKKPERWCHFSWRCIEFHSAYKVFVSNNRNLNWTEPIVVIEFLFSVGAWLTRHDHRSKSDIWSKDENLLLIFCPKMKRHFSLSLTLLFWTDEEMKCLVGRNTCEVTDREQMISITISKTSCSLFRSSSTSKEKRNQLTSLVSVLHLVRLNSEW